MPPLEIALVAGGLSTVNPCGFALLPAFLSLYVGADEARLPGGATRVMQGLLVGLVVTGGFLTTFGAIGLPLVLGAGRVVDAIPWAGLTMGVALVVMGTVLLAGGHASITLRSPVTVHRDRRLATVYLFGVGYGAASLGCALPVLLAVVGASLAGHGVIASLQVLAFYAAGMGLVLMALSVSAALLRDGLARRLKSILPYSQRIAGALLTVTGAYLGYYWWRVRFGDIATLGRDPLVSSVERLTAFVQRLSSTAGRWIILGAAVLVAGALLSASWRRRSNGPDQGPRTGRPRA